MGKPLDEPTKIMGFFPFGDAVLFLMAILLTAFITFLTAKITSGFFPMFFFMGATLVLIIIFILKNIFPAGFFPGLYHHMTTPRLKIPGRERSEV